MDQVTAHFHWVDYCLFLAMFAMCMGIGVYHGCAGGGHRSTDSYFMGNRQMKLIPVMLSITVSLISGNTILGCPAEIYLYGIHYVLVSIASTVAGLVVAWLLVPILYQLNSTSIHEYLEVRFQSRLVRLLGTCLLFVNQALYVGTVIFGPATVLQTVTGVPAWASILLVSSLGTAYTALGGMTAVIWTDAFQAIIIIGGSIVIIILGVIEVGGVSQVWNINQQWGRLNLSVDPDPTVRATVWTAVVGFSFTFMAMYGANQPCMQRTCAMPTEWQGRKSMALNGPMFGLMTVLSAVIGLVAFAYYAARECDPVAVGLVSNANQILPYFVMGVINYPGIPGVFMACLFSAALSSLSSSINSITAVIWEDILKDHFQHLPERRKTLLTKMLAVTFGVFSMGVSFLVLIVGGSLVQIALSFMGASLGPLLGLYVLGAAFPWANWIGALVGGLMSLSCTLFIMLGQIFSETPSARLPSPTQGCHMWLPHHPNSTSPWESSTSSLTLDNLTTPYTQVSGEHSPIMRWLFSVSYAWFGFGSVLLTVMVGIIVSLVTGGFDHSEVESALFFSFIRSKYGKDEKTDLEKDPAAELPMAQANISHTRHALQAVTSNPNKYNNGLNKGIES